MERFSRRLGIPVVMTDELQTKLVKTSKGGTSVAPNMASKYDPSGYLCFLQRLPNVIGKVKVKRVGIAPLSRCTKEKKESYGFRKGYENLRTSKMLLRVQQDMCFSFLLSPCVCLYLTLPRLELLHLTWVNPKLSSRQGRLRRVVGLVRWMKKRLFFRSQANDGVIFGERSKANWHALTCKRFLRWAGRRFVFYNCSCRATS
ncbi:hypothetical protein VFPPC_17951 [Pochonia chlamydosporia 170]|uniref:Uncharacterized protein n=1 Tax=Pochonia chlamydosporia 170 TaxID=1380566 RepID=A0A219APW1_METCM|nr:hypothetical protein VFPPC_17951 [Pochonia chlamydosporia 170]OWT42856.1 hypothetical protein VFPPC_17951 [Pochonia chlamydosporia 170]